MPEDYQQPGAPEPSLKRRSLNPKGVMHGNPKKLALVIGLMVIFAGAIISSIMKKPLPSRYVSPEPMVLGADPDANAKAYSREMQPPPNVPNPDYAPGGKYFGCPPPLPGQPQQPCTPQMQQQGPEQLDPVEEQERQIAAREREMDYSSRFAPSVFYTRPPAKPEGQSSAPQQQIGAAAPKDVGEQARSSEIDVNASVGPLYVLREGTIAETTLVNRLDGDTTGHVIVQVSTAVWSHDNQHVLIPDGTKIYGESRAIGSTGFGQRRRIAVVFHRMIMPDGYSVDLDKFSGLDQIGEGGLKDIVDNHYLQIFGASIALGVIAGAAEVEMGGGAFSSSGFGLFTTGASSNLSSSATTILDRFIQIPPTIKIREGHRVKVYFTNDLRLPAWENHRIAQSF